MRPRAGDPPIQLRARGSGSTGFASTATRTGVSGLPRRLAAGIESLSGVDMSGVRVHHGSSMPSRYDAHSFAQGTDIHLGPGQEQHLAHEAWHVVQQLQGRVAPTREVAGARANDDRSLEREADTMGQRALDVGASVGGASQAVARSPSSAAPLQFARHVGAGQSYATNADAVTEAQAMFGNRSGRIAVRAWLDAAHTDNVNFSFNMTAAGRWAGRTWVSNDVDLGNNRSLHFTCSLDRMQITHATGAATIDLTNFHSTIRTDADSTRLGELAAAHVGDPAGLAAEADYRTIQARSLHRAPGGAAWNSGNPANTAAATAHLALPAATLTRFDGAALTACRDAFGDSLTNVLVGKTFMGTAITGLTINW